MLLSLERIPGLQGSVVSVPSITNRDARDTFYYRKHICTRAAGENCLCP